MFRYFTGLGILILSAAGLLLAGLAVVLLSLPDVSKIKTCFTTEMFEVKLCPGTNTYVPLREISPHMIASVIISEDAGFYQHSGFDFNEIKDSLSKNLKEGSYVRGGSTITQQLVKNVFLNQEKSILRKLKEAFLTYELEKSLKKNEILEKYLNVVQFGEKIFGVKAAAQYYFGKEPRSLNVLESAFLTSLLPNPVKYSQSYRQKTLTKFMRGRVLTISRKLVLTGRISSSEYEFAKSNVDTFPWHGLGNAEGTSEDVLNSFESIDFSKSDSEPDMEISDEVVIEAEPERGPESEHRADSRGDRLPDSETIMKSALEKESSAGSDPEPTPSESDN